ncbi:MAG: hypothetical protein HRU70_04615 [Phycisphaeraceae bacterium]|nr:MAG: hypothetical protein HRU70_04615 [Phycisphaeraceae bacterium]
MAARVNTPAAEDLSAPPPELRAADAPAGSFPLYRHPADRNAAATSIFAGRNLDVTA